MADRVASFGGSWSFIGLFALVLIGWMAYNAHARAPFDPFPFDLLNLVLSCLAAVQAPLIMMSQNRMAAKDRSDARHDYEVNLKAEMEIMQLHAKLDELVAERWKELLAVQDEQIAALRRIEAHAEVDAPRPVSPLDVRAVGARDRHARPFDGARHGPTGEPRDWIPAIAPWPGAPGPGALASGDAPSPGSVLW